MYKTSKLLIGTTVVLVASLFSLPFTIPQIQKYFKLADLVDAHDEQSPESGMAAVEAALSQVHKKYDVNSNTPQFVLFSFDGSKSVDFLNQTRDFSKQMIVAGKPIHFTYFINAVYFLTQENANFYHPPEHPVGTSNIGFSNNVGDISERVKSFNAAMLEGHEVGSHSAGHFDGTTWSYADWTQEFEQFNTILNNVQKNSMPVLVNGFNIASTSVGFRAPLLGVNANLYKVLKDFGYTYDASDVATPGNWPSKDQEGIWHVPLALVRIKDMGDKPIVAMDYNFYAQQSGAKDIVKKGTPEWQHDFDEMKTAYEDYFNSQYNGNRAPVVFGGHFSQWNDGVYWEAMKSVAQDVCGLANVRCVTFTELVNYLNTTGVPALLKN